MSEPEKEAARQQPPGRPGIIVRGFPPDRTDQEVLELYFGKYGDIKTVEMSEGGQAAYVEFADPSGNMVSPYYYTSDCGYIIIIILLSSCFHTCKVS